MDISYTLFLSGSRVFFPLDSSSASSAAERGTRKGSKIRPYPSTPRSVLPGYNLILGIFEQPPRKRGSQTGGTIHQRISADNASDAAPHRRARGDILDRQVVAIKVVEWRVP